MPEEGSVYDGSTWRGGNFTEMHVYTGSAWEELDEAHVYIGSAWEQFFGAVVCSGTIDCAALNLCQSGDSMGVCNTLKGCNDAGEQHRIQWSHTGCDANCEIAIHRSINGGSYFEAWDGLACCPADPDSLCCEFFTGGCADDCNVMTSRGVSSGSSCTTTFKYKVRLETAGTDTEIDSAETGTKTGCDSACILL